MSDHADTIHATIETSGDVSALVASWRRCVKVHGVDPDRTDPPEADPAAWREGCERNARMVAVAAPHLDELFRLLADTECGIFLTDRDGTMLDLRTNRSMDTWHRSPEAWLGTCYSERLLGTNGIGTCLAEERAIILRGSQHLLSRYADRFCIGVPIFGPDGSLCGCLAINQNLDAGDGRLDSFLSSAVAGFARRIEIELFAASFPETRLMLATPTGTPPCAVLAVDRDDCIVGATRAARRVLDLPNQIVGGSVDTVLDLQPRTAGRALAEAERRTIGRVLTSTSGNLSAAAKAMGISRSTLYRKLAAYEVRR